MIRISARGALLAARGNRSEQLADSAAYIHELMKLIAKDLMGRGSASIHVRGGGRSLLVVRSEVKDVAAALGPSPRLASLVKKAGLG